MSAKPEISVVVPARDAEGTLHRLLAALDRSTFAGAWELVVVDDASTDRTAALAGEWGAEVVMLRTQSGPAAARNAGVARARADLIAFTDADCEPTAAWLGAVRSGLEDADLVTGPVRPLPGVQVGAFDRTLAVGPASPWFETANLAVRRDLVERVAGFQPFAPELAGDLPGLRPAVDQGHFGEDVMFGWAARRAGARIAHAPEALVHHAVFGRGASAFVMEHWRRRYFPALVRAIPELRPVFWHRHFLDRRTALFDLAVVGVVTALLRRRTVPATAVLPYAALHLRHARVRRPGSMVETLAFVAADAVSLAALTRGSIAARRLLL